MLATNLIFGWPQGGVPSHRIPKLSPSSISFASPLTPGKAIAVPNAYNDLHRHHNSRVVSDGGIPGTSSRRPSERWCLNHDGETRLSSAPSSPTCSSSAWRDEDVIQLQSFLEAYRRKHLSGETSMELLKGLPPRDSTLSHFSFTVCWVSECSDSGHLTATGRCP
jgi:hypothetical protein